MRMERIRQAKTGTLRSLPCRCRAAHTGFPADKVVYIESSGHNLTFHTVEGTTPCGASMRSWRSS